MHDDLECEGMVSTARRWRSPVEELCSPASQSEPCYLGDRRGVVRLGPETEGPSVLFVQRRLLDVVQVAGASDGSLGDAFVPRVQWDALQAQLDVVLKAAEVAVREQSPWPDVDVQVAVGESVQAHRVVAVVAMGEDDEEVFWVVLDDGDVFRQHPKLGADGPLDHLGLDLRAVPADPGDRRVGKAAETPTLQALAEALSGGGVG